MPLSPVLSAFSHLHVGVQGATLHASVQGVMAACTIAMLQDIHSHRR